MSVSILSMGLLFISYVVNYSSLIKSGKICQLASLVCTYKRGIRAMQRGGVGDVSLSWRMFVLDGGVYDATGDWKDFDGF
jgi:hypothetical protein